MRRAETDVISKLSGGDRRSLGQADEVASEIARDPRLFAQVFQVLLGDDLIMCRRAADAIEKASRNRPGLLGPCKRKLLRKATLIEDAQVRWHVIQLLPRLKLTSTERDYAVSVLLDYLDDKSSIVRTFTMQALADFAIEDRQFRARVVPLIEFLTREGTAAMRARGRKLLKALGK